MQAAAMPRSSDSHKILYHIHQATCWRREVKGIVRQVNSIYNGWRMEDVWLDR